MNSNFLLDELPTVLVDTNELYYKAFDGINMITNNDTTEMNKMKQFYETNGFVVISNVYSNEVCHSTIDAMWGLLENSNPKFNRDDINSWNEFKTTGKYGLSTRGPSFHPTLASNRQNPILAAVLTELLKGIDVETHAGLDSSQDIMVSHDRYTVYRATVFDNCEYNHVDGKQFSTGRRNVHLDLNPWWWLEGSQDVIIGAESLQYNDPQDFIKENNLVVNSMGSHVQIVMNFMDNRVEDGGTIVVPCFHRHLATWCEENKQSRKPLPWVEFAPHVEEKLLQHAHRISMKAGSALIWNQTVAHGTAPNDSNRCRMAQYMKAFTRSAVFNNPNLIIKNNITDKDKGTTITKKVIKKSKNKKNGAVSVDTSVVAADADGDVAVDSLDSIGSINLDENINNQKKKTVSTVNPRLLRRAKALHRLLSESEALDQVTPLGRYLFGLDVLEEDNSISNVNK